MRKRERDRRMSRNRMRAKPMLSKLLISNRIDSNSTNNLCNTGIVMRERERENKKLVSFGSPVCWCIVKSCAIARAPTPIHKFKFVLAIDTLNNYIHLSNCICHLVVLFIYFFSFFPNEKGWPNANKLERNCISNEWRFGACQYDGKNPANHHYNCSRN